MTREDCVGLSFLQFNIELAKKHLSGNDLVALYQEGAKLLKEYIVKTKYSHTDLDSLAMEAFRAMPEMQFFVFVSRFHVLCDSHIRGGDA